MIRRTVSAVFAVFVGFASGCDATNQDKGSSRSQAVSGVAVDGHLAHALVFADTNDNYILDTWEPYAYTDGDGYFSKAKDGTDYCASTATEERCLRADVTEGATLRVQSGYDAVTGEPFVGTLTGRMPAGALTGVVSPLTALLGAMTQSEREIFVAAEINKALQAGIVLTEADMESDLLDFDSAMTIEQRRYLLSLALQAQKVGDVIATYLESQYGGFGASGQPADATGYVYEGIAREWAKPVGSWAEGGTSTTTTSIANIIAESNTTVASIVGVAEVTPPVGMEDQVEELRSFIEDQLSATTDQTTVEAQLRAIEVFTAILRQWDATLLSALDDLSTTLQTYAGQLGATTDVKDLTQELVAWLQQDAAYRAANPFVLPDYSARTPLPVTSLDGLSISSSGDSASFQLQEDGSVVLTLDYASDSSMTSSGSQISGTVEPLTDYSLLLNLEIAGVIEPVIVKSNADGSYTFDYDGNNTAWQ